MQFEMFYKKQKCLKDDHIQDTLFANVNFRIESDIRMTNICKSQCQSFIVIYCIWNGDMKLYKSNVME